MEGPRGVFIRGTRSSLPLAEVINFAWKKSDSTDDKLCIHVRKGLSSVVVKKFKI